VSSPAPFEITWCVLVINHFFTGNVETLTSLVQTDQIRFFFVLESCHNLIGISRPSYEIVDILDSRSILRHSRRSFLIMKDSREYQDAFPTQSPLLDKTQVDEKGFCIVHW
jgi:hypothetical protein